MPQSSLPFMTQQPSLHLLGAFSAATRGHHPAGPCLLCWAGMIASSPAWLPPCSSSAGTSPELGSPSAFGAAAHQWQGGSESAPSQAPKISIPLPPITQPAVYTHPGHSSRGRGMEPVIQALGYRMYGVPGMKWAEDSTSNEHVPEAAGTHGHLMAGDRPRCLPTGRCCLSTLAAHRHCPGLGLSPGILGQPVWGGV